MGFLKAVGGALGVGLAWFMAGAMVALVVFEGLVDPDGKIVDIWPAALGYPAFISGVGFFVLTRLFGGSRRLHEVSKVRATVLGGLSGALVLPAIVILILLVEGDIKWNEVTKDWREISAILGSAIIGSAFLGWATAAFLKQAHAAQAHHATR